MNWSAEVTWRRALVAVLTSALLSACAGEAPATGESSHAPTDATDDAQVDAPDAWGALQARFAQQQAVTTELALDTFATLIGPIEGGQAVPGGVPEHVSGTVAVRWILGAWDELSPSQQEAVGEAVFGSRYVGAGSVGPPDQAAEDLVAALTAELRRTEAEFTDLFPVKITTTELIVSETPDSEEPGTSASAEPAVTVDGQLDFDFNDAMDTCVITVYPPGVEAYRAYQAGGRTRTAIAFLAHEFFHCSQFAEATDIRQIDHWPRWLVEGSASWAARKYEYARTGTPHGASLPDTRRDGLWDDYLGKDDEREGREYTPLFARDYDAVGLFAHIENVGGDPWKAIREMFKSLGSGPDWNERAWQKLVSLTEPLFVEHWAMGLVRASDLGARWETTGPGITDFRPKLRPVVLDDTEELSSEPGSVVRANISIGSGTGRVLLVGIGAVGAFSWYDSNGPQLEQIIAPIDIPNLDGSHAYCVDPDGCQCADGTKLTKVGISGQTRTIVVEPSPIPNPTGMIVAFTGGILPGRVVFATRLVEEFCDPQPTGPVSRDACTAVTEAEVEAAVGVDMKLRDEFPGACQWSGATDSGTTVLVGVRPPDEGGPSWEVFSAQLKKLSGWDCTIQAKRFRACVTMSDPSDPADTRLEGWIGPSDAFAIYIDVDSSPPVSLDSAEKRRTAAVSLGETLASR